MVLLHCETCGGAVKNRHNENVCDIDGKLLTPAYKKRIVNFGCNYFTCTGVPRKNSKNMKYLPEGADE